MSNNILKGVFTKVKEWVTSPVKSTIRPIALQRERKRH